MSRVLGKLITGAGLAWALGACTSPQVGTTCSVPDPDPKKSADQNLKDREKALSQCFSQFSDNVVDAKIQKDVDILFLIDNSPSMSPKQKALASNIPRFIQKIEETGANYHVGVVTSDVGSYTAAGAPWSVNLGSCNSFEGDDGLLQRAACNTRTGVSSDALSACNTLCKDPSFVPSDGKGFISKINGVTNVPKDTTTMPGSDIGPQRAFQCMALVGDNGCGIEGQLEGAKRALDGHNPNNADFLRPSSVLAVIFITDEDDCSVSASGRKENDPVTMDCPAPDKNAGYSCFNPDYRCLARDVVCTEPTNSLGEKHNCVERDTSYLESVGTYSRFFHSLRPDNKLLISGIWSPSIDKGGKFVVIPDVGAKTDQFNRGKGPDAACVNAGDANVFGRPQVRLSKFISQFKDNIEVSVCDTDNYPKALESIAKAIKTKIDTQCISVVPKTDPKTNKPICYVGDVDATVPNSAPDQPFPSCSDGCCKAWAGAATPTVDDANIKAACTAETTDACYCAIQSTVGVCTGGAVAGVWRKTAQPANKVTNFKCSRGG